MRHVSTTEITQHPFRDNGQKIRRARERVPSPRDAGRPISQEDFAPVLGTSRRHVIRLENGEQRPSGQLRDRIVAVTGTEERIESDDDEAEEDLLSQALLDRIAAFVQRTPSRGAIHWRDLYASVDMTDVTRMRRDAYTNLVSAREIEEELLCRGS